MTSIPEIVEELFTDDSNPKMVVKYRGFGKLTPENLTQKLTELVAERDIKNIPSEYLIEELVKRGYLKMELINHNEK